MKKITFPQMLVYVSIGILFIYSLSIADFFVDSDIFWHIENGRYMIEHKEIVKHAIHTYLGDDIPYVPHEWLYDIVHAVVYNISGWNGIMVLTLAMFVFMSYTMVKLMNAGIEDNRSQAPTSYHYAAILMFIVACVITYIGYKAYIFSMVMVMWFFIFLRQYHRDGGKKEALWMIVISFLFANIHGGLWIIMFAFFMMMVVEKISTKKMTKKDILLVCAIIVAGCINPGGIKTFAYTFVVGDTKNYLQNFSSIQFDTYHYFFFINLAVMLYLSYFIFGKSLFHKLFVLGMLFLGTMSYYHHLYMMVMIPYLIGTSLHQALPVEPRESLSFLTQKRTIFLMIATTVVAAGYHLYKGETVPKKYYPVEEMTYILKDHPTKRPKVLADFNSSGYVVFKRADVLADSRVDPYVQPQTKNKEGDTAVERLFKAYASEINNDYLKKLAKEEQVDYVIVPDIGKKEMKKFEKTLGKPDFKGSYGYVWKK